MSIFTLYPKIDYKVSDYDTVRGIDITSSVKIKDYLKRYSAISYQPYVVLDGERPDQVSFKAYGTPDYDWIIMLANDMYSIYDDWPKSSLSLTNYITEKYGTVAYAQTNYKYYNTYGDEIDLTSYTALADSDRKIETLYEYEFRKNINKSKIKIIRSSIITTLDSDLKSLVRISVT
ncbi:hypothetical protein EBS02_00305 [bacterium]|nr:hypothetical protein [bacterium]